MNIFFRYVYFCVFNINIWILLGEGFLFNRILGVKSGDGVATVPALVLKL